MPSLHLLFILLALFQLTGCASMIGSATQRMADNLSSAMLNQDDPELVKAASPAYLIMLDSLVEGDPENVNLLISASRMYASYTGALWMKKTDQDFSPANR